MLAQIGRLHLRAQRIVEGTISGLHRSPFHGVSVEFADYRQYTPGDDLKNLDWKVFARSERFFIKRYEEETNLRCTLVVDTSGSMKYGRVDEPDGAAMTKFEYGITLAASMAQLLIRQRDAVGLVTFDTEPRAIMRPAATTGQLTKMIDTLERIAPGGETELGGVLDLVAGQIKSRGLVVVISDFLGDPDSLQKALGRLRHNGHEVLVFQLLDPDEIDLPFDQSTIFKDIEGSQEIHAEPWAFRKAYQEAMQAFITDLGQRCRVMGIDHLQFTTGDDLGKALSHYLHLRMFMAGRGAGGSAGGGPRL